MTKPPAASSRPLHAVLSRRERQIMDILYQLGRATAADLIKQLPGEPSDSTVRTSAAGWLGSTE